MVLVSLLCAVCTPQYSLFRLPFSFQQQQQQKKITQKKWKRQRWDGRSFYGINSYSDMVPTTPYTLAKYLWCWHQYNLTLSQLNSTQIGVSVVQTRTRRQGDEGTATSILHTYSNCRGKFYLHKFGFGHLSTSDTIFWVFVCFVLFSLCSRSLSYSISISIEQIN